LLKGKVKLNKRITWIILLIGITIPLIVYAQSNQNKQQIDPSKVVENIQQEINYKPVDITPKTPFPTGSTTPTIKTQYNAPVQATGNENIVWDFLITRYTRNQTAGIMGNLQQEHNFQTSGDGLAQWNGGRKARLMAMPDPYNIYTQLNFLVMEMNESGLILPDDVVGSTRTFQNQFERCGVCNEIARINYAYAILEKH